MVKAAYAGVGWNRVGWLRAADGFGIAKVHPDLPGGGSWACRWARGVERTLTFGMDKRDKRFQVLGLGSCRIAGHEGPRAGEALLAGLAPCLFVRGFDETGPGGDLEITLYAAAGPGVLRLSHAGLEAVCRPWGPEGDWLGFKLISRRSGDARRGRGRWGEVLIDRSGGLAGGAWESLGGLEAAGEAAAGPSQDSSVYVRITGCAGMTLRHFSVREIAPLGQGPALVRETVPERAAARSRETGPRDSGTFGW